MASPGAANEARVEELLSRLDVEEKAALCAGASLWYGNGAPRLGVPPLKLTDGPIGARGGHLGSGPPSSCFPNGSALGATWDPALVEAVGAAIAREARDRHCHVLLGPTVNLHRSPLGGRHFECYSEDPCLSERMAVAFVRGVQSQGVAACPKHLAANDSEFERHTIDSQVDERTLHELTLRPFEAAVREASAWSVMAAYNDLNGAPCTAHPELLLDILKRDWGFDGVVVSDWFAVKDTVGAGSSGLDLEMPGPPRFFGPALAAAVKHGEVPEARLDDMVRRVLRLMERTGALDAEQPEPAEEGVDRREHRELARRAAQASAVLLRNEGAALPLRAEGLRRLAVIGPNAAHTSIQGGGSARVVPFYEVHALDAIRERLGDAVEVIHRPGCTSHKMLPVLSGAGVEAGDGERGFRGEFFAGPEPGGEPVLVRPSGRVDFTWLGEVHPSVPTRFSARFRTRFTPQRGGRHRFGLTSSGLSRLAVDGAPLIDNWSRQVRGDSYFGSGTREEIGEVELQAGQPVELLVEYSNEGAGVAGLRLGHLSPLADDPIGEAVEAARAADAAVVVAGLNADWETEGHDKDDMRLPGAQDELIAAVAAANPRTVVVLNAGAPLEMPWADDVAAILLSWYGGQEAGRAIADLLFGDAEPGGRLPTTFPRALSDAPCHAMDDAEVYPGREGRVRYAEGVFTGHRHYDAHGLEPRFPFGHGLSYARFAFGPLRLAHEEIGPDQALEATVELRNEGDRPGSEVVQAYLHDEEASVPRPVQELVAFAKVELAPGEAREVTLRIPPRALAFWDTAVHGFRVEPGSFELRVGRSSRDLPGRARFRVRAG